MKTINFLKETNIIRLKPSDTLATAMGKMNSSHDAGFVFDEYEKYYGLVNPYYSLIKSSLPANAKVEHCIFHAPRVRPDYPITKVAQLMIESKVHYLPVFDDKEKFLGIVSARRILSLYKDNPILKVSIRDVLKKKKLSLVSIHEDETLATALSELKNFKVSKLVVINKDRKLRGVVSYYDLISFLIAPRQKERKGEKTGDKYSFNRQKVRNFAKTYVLTLSQNNLMEEALKLILDKKIGSVVIIDTDKRPVGIITSKDILALITRRREEEVLEVVSKDLSRENRKIVGNFFDRINHWVKQLPNVAKARLFVREEKQGGVFRANLSLFKKKGDPTVIKQEGKNLVDVLKDINKD